MNDLIEAAKVISEFVCAERGVDFDSPIDNARYVTGMIEVLLEPDSD